MKLDTLENFLNKKICPEMPLFHNNPGNALKLDFEDISDIEERKVIIDILSHLFRGQSLWVCEAGSINAKNIFGQKLLRPPFAEVCCIPHQFPYDEDFDYGPNYISCCFTDYSHFEIQAYVEYVLSDCFLSNLIYLVDDKKEVALHIYDSRGMDIVSTDRDLLINIATIFHVYLSKYWKTGIPQVDQQITFV